MILLKYSIIFIWSSIHIRFGQQSIQILQKILMHGLTTIWNGTEFEYYPSILLVEFDKH